MAILLRGDKSFRQQDLKWIVEAWDENAPLRRWRASVRED